MASCWLHASLSLITQLTYISQALLHPGEMLCGSCLWNVEVIYHTQSKAVSAPSSNSPPNHPLQTPSIIWSKSGCPWRHMLKWKSHITRKDPELLNCWSTLGQYKWDIKPCCIQLCGELGGAYFSTCCLMLALTEIKISLYRTLA